MVVTKYLVDEKLRTASLKSFGILNLHLQLRLAGEVLLLLPSMTLQALD